MGKKRQKGGNPKKQTPKSEGGGSSRGDPPDDPMEAGGSIRGDPADDPMAVEEDLPDFPYFTFNNKRVFESYIPDPNNGIERGAPFKIRRANNEGEKIVVRPSNHDERKILRVSHYGDKLSDVFYLVELSKHRGGYVSNMCRELIRGIVKEFCHQMRVDPDQPLYLQNLDNYLLRGFEPYRHSDPEVTNVNLERIRLNDEFSTPIKVIFVNSNRSGRKQCTELEKLAQLKNVIRSIHTDISDPEFTHFLSAFSVSAWKDAKKHSFLWHWDVKLDCIWYMHRQLYLEGNTADYAIRIFDDVAFVEEDWERALLRDYPPRHVYDTKVDVVRPGDLGVSTNVGPSTGTPRSTITPPGASSLSQKRNRQQRGKRLIRILRNLGWHLTETIWNPVTGNLEYVNIRDGEVPDADYKNRVHLYRLIKTVFPRFWITFVPILRSKGFKKY